MSPQGQEACKPKSQIRPGSKNTYRQDKRITGAAKLNLAAWLEEFGWLKWNDPVGVQAATIKPDLTTSLRAAWTSTSKHVNKLYSRAGSVMDLVASHCLKSKTPENGRSICTCVGGFELQGVGGVALRRAPLQNKADGG